MSLTQADQCPQVPWLNRDAGFALGAISSDHLPLSFITAGSHGFLSPVPPVRWDGGPCATEESESHPYCPEGPFQATPTVSQTGFLVRGAQDHDWQLLDPILPGQGPGPAKLLCGDLHYADPHTTKFPSDSATNLVLSGSKGLVDTTTWAPWVEKQSAKVCAPAVSDCKLFPASPSQSEAPWFHPPSTFLCDHKIRAAPTKQPAVGGPGYHPGSLLPLGEP